MLNVLVAVEKPVWQKGFQAILNTRSIDVRLRYAGSIDGLFRQQSLKEYDVVIFNLHSSDKHQLLDSLYLLRRKHPETRFALIDNGLGCINILDFYRAGVLAFIDEHAANEQIIAAVAAAARGDLYISSSIINNVPFFNSSVAGDILGTPEAQDSDVKRLSERELETLRLVARGMSNRAIAEELFISEKTVKNHLYSAFKKLGVRDRTQAAMAVVKGLLSHENGSFGPT
ncbi:MAG: LuxR C-terminal-related transcriptional regulator [Bacillota bacterium]|jgi:two-component system response regulator DegU